MSPQPTASGAGHVGAMPAQQPLVEPIHGSDYGLQFEGSGVDPSDGAAGDFWLVVKKIAGEWCALRRYQDKTSALDYVTTQVRALKARGRK